MVGQYTGVKERANSKVKEENQKNKKDYMNFET